MDHMLIARVIRCQSRVRQALAAIGACVALSVATPADAVFVIDTGPATDPNKTGYIYTQYIPDLFSETIAARFSLTEAAEINRIDVWLDWSGGSASTGLTGRLDLSVRLPNGTGLNYFLEEPFSYSGMPGTALFARTYALAANPAPRWESFAVSLTLGPGTYWIDLSDDYDDGFSGALYGGAPNPLERHFQFAIDSASNGWIDREGYDWGFRVSAVPEPATALMLLLGLGILAARQSRSSSSTAFPKPSLPRV